MSYKSFNKILSGSDYADMKIDGHPLTPAHHESKLKVSYV